MSTDTQNMLNAVQSFNSVFSTPENITLFNQVMDDPYNNLICVEGTDCFKEREAKTLEQKMLQAKTNLQQAPKELEVAEKSYYTFTLGKAGYRQKLEKEVQDKIDKEIQQMQNQYSEEINEAVEFNHELQSLLENETDFAELYDVYLEKNRHLSKEMQQVDADIVTNDRKTYYENQKWSQLLWWHRVFFVLYVVMAIVVILYTLFFRNDKWDKKAFVVVVIAAFPFLVRRLLVLVIRLFLQFSHWLPQNVYF